MKGRRPQQYRIRRILEMIREGNSRGELRNTGWFRRELEVSARTIANDLDYLRDDLNAPIEYDPCRHGYRLADPTWDLPPTQLCGREVAAFAMAARLLRAFRGTPVEKDMRAAMSKIEHSLEGKLTFEHAGLLERFSVLGDDYAAIDTEVWEATADALVRNETMEVDYVKFNGQQGAYRLDPYHLVAYHGDWYLLAYHHRRASLATFALSRVRRAAATGCRFELPPDFDPAERLRDGFGITGGEQRIRVRLRFAPKVASYIRHRVWHRGQQMIDRRDGGVELRFETTGWKEVVRFVLSWQPDVQVLAPKALRDRVAAKMREALRAGS